MAASYRVTALDLLRTQASSEEDNRKAVARYYGGALLLAHVVDVCSAVGLLVAYTDGHWRALVAPLLRLDFAFRKELTDMLALALLRAFLFPALTVLAVRFGRAPYAKAACCGCGRKKEGSNRASDASGGAYVALGGPTTPANIRDTAARPGRRWGSRTWATLTSTSTGCGINSLRTGRRRRSARPAAGSRVAGT